jgi:hypothetical protein
MIQILVGRRMKGAALAPVFPVDSHCSPAHRQLDVRLETSAEHDAKLEQIVPEYR